MLTLRSFINNKNKLNDDNFLDWYRDLWIVLEDWGRLYVIDRALQEPDDANFIGEIDFYQKKLNDKNIDLVKFVMLASMTPELQKQFEDMSLAKTIFHLCRRERYRLSKQLFSCRMQ